MIQIRYDMKNHYQIALYLRMSGEMQNPRSPQQQNDTIHEVMKRHSCPWNVVRIYQDLAIKGRYILRRPGLQNLLRDIKAGIIKIDLIVVDTWERFGRAEEFEQIRRELRTNHGVLIVAADSNFADPTGVAGRALSLVENIRATEDGRIKAHNVIRGKKDTVRLKRWPGGPRPFGYAFERHVDESRSKPRVYSTLIVEPKEADVVRGIFQLAADTGRRGAWLAGELNANKDIPEEFKPFNGSTIDSWLSNPLYIGTCVWGEHNCDIVNDCRVIQPNPNPEEILSQAGFCEPIVDLELFNRVTAVADERRRKWLAQQAALGVGEDAKIIKPISGGVSLKYELSGLVRCGDCGSCMIPGKSGRKSKGGMEYSYFRCPRYLNRACSNSNHVRVEDLRAAVYSRLRAKLFPLSDQPLSVPSWFADLVRQVDLALDRRNDTRPDRVAGQRRDIAALQTQLDGWMMSMGSRDIAESTRQDILAKYEAAKAAKTQKEQDLREDEAMGLHLKKILDPALVIDRLKYLETVMASTNASYVNVELSRHIGQIECFFDGRVIMSGTYLGVFEGAEELLAGTGDIPVEKTVAPSQFQRVVARRLGRRRYYDPNDQPLGSTNQAGIDPGRFDGLGAAFVWDEALKLPERLSWAEVHAMEVWEFDQQHPDLRRDKLCAHFGKSRPTILKALRIAAKRLEKNPGESPET